ncbi:hypothetical protein HF313_16410 [Massilia atriviolacea]|uniref:Uncharacterized protein n=1 Tax=Massilia atriviolacea TaxID=2495579 RepID=A0A430HU87_9BURK|nr:hypothetical protein [Massilia atriviolacea]RSZ61107.1 hypothetical protein EJB06_02980 [Massilia atriviolacea]
MFTPSLTRTLSVSSLHIPPQEESAPAQANRPPAAAQDAPGTDAASPRAAAAAGEATMRGLLVKVVGTTNTVAPIGDSIFHGKEVGTLAEGKILEIETHPDHVVPSRRGPNQEVLRNHKADAKATEKNHMWHPLFAENKARYKDNDWPHIRSDAFAEVNAEPHKSLSANLPGRLRARAAPIDGYKKIADMSAGDFIAEQKAYQTKLLSKHTKDSIMSSHRSVGFEYEFTGHSLAGTASHIILARTPPQSDLFGIGFELETDSGDVVEIGMPPFIVPNKTDGSPDRKEIQEIHIKMRAALGEVRTAANKLGSANLDALLELLKEKGVGTGWVRSTAQESAIEIDNMQIVEPTASKLQGGNIYSQMNISLNGDEIADAIIGSRVDSQDEDTSTADRSHMGILCKELDDTALAHLEAQAGDDAELEALPAHFIHLNKALANTMAIPSILIQRVATLPDDDDYSSIVKELASVWAKDWVPNILATTSASRDDLAAMKTYAQNNAKPLALKKLEGLLTELQGKEGLTNPRQVENNAWVAFKNGSHDEYFNGTTLTRLTNHSEALKNNEQYRSILALATELNELVDSDGNLVNAQKKVVPEDHKDYSGLDEVYADKNERFNQRVATETRASAWTPLMAGVKAVVEREIDNTIAMIDSEAVVSHPNPRETGGEEYGIAGRPGVRRETYVDQPLTQAEAEAGGKRQEDLLAIVTELRSSLAMKQYFERQA